MIRSAKRIKLEQDVCQHKHRNLVKQSLMSGQFMTSRIDDNEVRKKNVFIRIFVRIFYILAH